MRPPTTDPMGSRLRAGFVERREFAAAQRDDAWRQTAVPRNPAADLGRIEAHHQRGPLARRHKGAPGVVIIRCRVESEHRPPRHAHLVGWYDGGEQHAGRETRPVDDETLAGVADVFEL